ncbi:MAG: hypothetical protein NT118_02985 [Lentisphaerae bacterium]|nr:hypothetical protein [Lentisphaerota bacterium]
MSVIMDAIPKSPINKSALGGIQATVWLNRGCTVNKSVIKNDITLSNPSIFIRANNPMHVSAWSIKLVT